MLNTSVFMNFVFVMPARFGSKECLLVQGKSAVDCEFNTRTVV